jgi:hypothetical protein
VLLSLPLLDVSPASLPFHLPLPFHPCPYLPLLLFNPCSILIPPKKKTPTKQNLKQPVWPYNLVTCALFNTLHTQQYSGVGSRGGFSREKFFYVAFAG